LVEEIKTVEQGWSRGLPILCTGRSYGFTRAFSPWIKDGPNASLQLTYLELDTEEVFLSPEETSREDLIEFLNETNGR